MSNKYPAYLDEEVLNATPLRFVFLLYRAALDSIASARRYIRLGDIRARSLAISKAMRIVAELSLSLDRKAGGELSKNLAELYSYVQSLLTKANFKQSEAPLAEAERLLGTLAEAWEICAQSAPAPAAHQAQIDPKHEPLPEPPSDPMSWAYSTQSLR
jgi:flagellar secretion chaperone FliS